MGSPRWRCNSSNARQQRGVRYRQLPDAVMIPCRRASMSLNTASLTRCAAISAALAEGFGSTFTLATGGGGGGVAISVTGIASGITC